MKNLLLGALLVLPAAAASALLINRADPATSAQSAPVQAEQNAASMAPTPDSASGLANKLSKTNAAIAKQAAKHVVQVIVDRKRSNPSSEGPSIPLPIPNPFGLSDDPLFKDLTIGPYSGTVVSSDGEILVSDAILGEFRDGGAARSVRDIYVVLSDGRTLPATVVGRDGGADLALLKINVEGLTPIAFDTNSALMQENALRGRSLSVVTRSFNPYRYGVADGIASAEFRERGKAFQLDARVGGSDLGGLIIDKNSREAVGLLTMLRVDAVGQASGVAYGANAGAVNDALERLRDGQFNPPPKTPYLGVMAEPAEEEGLLVTRVMPGTGAAKAGLTADDIIIRANGVEVSSIPELQRVLFMLKVGDELRLEITRDGEPMEIVATLGSRDGD